MQPDCFFQIWSSDPVPKDRCPIFESPREDLDTYYSVEETVHCTKSRRNRKMVDPIRKGDQFEYLTEMFIEICDTNRLDMERVNSSMTEKHFFAAIKIFDQKVKEWNSAHPGDLHDFFAVRLVQFLEARAINYQRAVDAALAIAYTAEKNFNGSILAERAIHDSTRAVKNASAILDAALSDVRIAKKLNLVTY